MMKRVFAILFALILALSLVPVAVAQVGFSSPNELEDGAFYTKEDMLAMYELGYNDGLKAAKSETGADLTLVTKTGSADSNTLSGITYVVNTNTEKFHYPTCKSVDKIKEKNRMDFSGTREELIAAGYSPCGSCKP